MRPFVAGEVVTWLWKPRGGWGYTIAVPCRVIACTPKRVRIAACLTNGDEEIRTVTLIDASAVDRPRNICGRPIVRYIP